MAGFFDPMELRRFYFIKNSFFATFPDPSLMQNKEDGHKRPCFFAIEDEDNLLWMIPISSKVEKYQEIYDRKCAKSGRCDTLFFASVLGQRRAFLIQNAFPVTERFIDDIYLQTKTKKPVAISDLESKELLSRFKRVLAMVKQGRRHLIFPDCLKIADILKTEKQ